MNSDKSKSALRDFSALADFSNLINSNLDVEFTLNNLTLTSLGKFHAGKAAVYLKNNEGELKLVFTKGKIRNGIDNLNSGSFDENLINLKREFPVLLPIKGRGEEVGLFCLGAKINNSQYSADDLNFLRLLLNIAATAIENSLNFEKLNKANKQLDSKVNQLSSLFDLSKEFSGLLDVRTITKLLVYSLIGQLMITDYAVILCAGNSFDVLESKFDNKLLESVFVNCDVKLLKDAVYGNEIDRYVDNSRENRIGLLVPMRIKDETRGFIILGERKNKLTYSKSDIDFISSLAGIAIISIENARLVEEVIEKEKMEKELETARDIQKSLLPQSIPDLRNFKIAAYSESAKQVGGDYYDVIPLDEYRTLIAIADVSGKGVQASLLMANLQAFLKSISKLNYSLDEASNFLNDLVSENTHMGNFITFFWGILDSQNMKLTYVNAGHNPVLLVREGKIHKLKKGGMILGVMKTILPYISEEIELRQGDAIVLFTDGVTEAMDNEFNEYTDERLEKLVLDVSNEEDAETILNSIKTDVLAHTRGNSQSDDITCMVVKVV